MIASLPREQRDQFLDSLSEDEADELLHLWEFWARIEQFPPDRAWRTWMVLAGRGFGKTRTGAEWVRQRVESGKARRIALVAPTAGDARDVMVEGESGILSVSPDRFRPHYEPSKRRLTWPNGAIATTFSADEPRRLRGPQHDTAWCDELGAWRYPQAWDMLNLGLRLGSDPRVCVTTTPAPSKLLRSILSRDMTVKTGGSTYENRANLAPQFFDEIIAIYEGTRLGLQEIHAELLDVTEGAWFPSFSMKRHVSHEATYQPWLAVNLAIDCGTSRHTGAVFFQVQRFSAVRCRVTVFADYYAEGLYSEANALAIREKALSVCGGRIDAVRLDPASGQRTGVGPAVYGEYERVFGSRLVSKWPMHLVADGLDQIELLMGSDARPTEILIHPDCIHLIDAFKNYSRATSGGEFLDYPLDPQHPYEDLMDALRGGLRDVFPEGRKPAPAFQRRRV